ncbi:hypothetical protein NF716_02685 [Lactococcus formosensis]|uniref:hypothetical protein n=1 Tax=Lactococcus formosensis TaxID=1281486 RepID=UPI00243550D6|nr:hypothetical protein [Lactococcus formosensis]MDG6155268.1 hypothetical protein [Lactococcus formosensis]
MVKIIVKIITGIGIIILSSSLIGCSAGDTNKSKSVDSKQNKENKKQASFNFIANKNQPETVQDFIPVFAQQLKKYNQVAEKIWPKSAVTNIPVVLEDTDSKKMWQITPDGQINDFSNQDAEDMNVDRSEEPGTWGYYGKQFDKFGVDAQYSLEGKTLESGGMYFWFCCKVLNKE